MISVQDILLRRPEASFEGIESSICRDIERLLGHAIRRDPDMQNSAFSSSVFNYGLPSMIGKRIESSTLTTIVNDVMLALTRFEPRLDPRSIHVEPQSASTSRTNIFALAVSARLARPPSLTPRSSDLHLRVSFDIHFGVATVESVPYQQYS